MNDEYADFDDEEYINIDENAENGDELYEHFRLTVDKGQAPIRIDRFLTARMENRSRNRIQTAAKAGSILVNGKSVKSNYKLKPLDEIVIVLSHPPVNRFLVPENIPLNIIYEDDDLLIVNKEAGMVAHPGVGNFYRYPGERAVVAPAKPAADEKQRCAGRGAFAPRLGAPH